MRERGTICLTNWCSSDPSGCASGRKGPDVEIRGKQFSFVLLFSSLFCGIAFGESHLGCKTSLPSPEAKPREAENHIFSF